MLLQSVQFYIIAGTRGYGMDISTILPLIIADGRALKYEFFWCLKLYLIVPKIMLFYLNIKISS